VVELDEMRQEAQLAAIRELHDVLEHAEIDHWLFGGWAVDFHAGRVTRRHDDVDLAVRAEDAGLIVDLLRERGWRHAPEPDEDGGTGYERDGVRVELTFLVRDADGRTCIHLNTGDFPFAGGAFATEVLELAGCRCRVIERSALVRMKSGSRGDPADDAKDAGDLATLS
jgi:Aminoglycoside-2''-adenylyltransferase